MRNKLAVFTLLTVFFLILPASAGTGNISLPDVSRISLENGGTAFLIQDELPRFSITASFGYGSCLESEETAGLGSLLAQHLPIAGSKQYPGDKLGSEVEALGGSISVMSGAERTSIRITVLHRFRKQAVDILADLIRNPRIDPKALDTAKELTGDSIRRNYDNPASIAILSLRSLLFAGEGYGRLQTVSKINSYSAEDIKKLAERIFSAKNMVIGIQFYGSAKETEELVLSAFGNMPAGSSMDYSADISALRKNIADISGKIFLYPKELPQSTVVAGALAPKAGSETNYAAEVMNYVLGGGGFNSLLFKEIRVKRGLAYSAYSGLNHLKHIGAFTAFTQVENDNVPAALELMLTNINLMTKQPVNGEDLEWVKRSISNSYVFEFETPADVLGKKMAAFLYNLPSNYYDEYLGRINAVSGTDAMESANELFNSGLVRIVVGPASLADKLKGFGKVEILRHYAD